MNLKQKLNLKLTFRYIQESEQIKTDKQLEINTLNIYN